MARLGDNTVSAFVASYQTPMSVNYTVARMCVVGSHWWLCIPISVMCRVMRYGLYLSRSKWNTGSEVVCPLRTPMYLVVSGGITSGITFLQPVSLRKTLHPPHSSQDFTRCKSTGKFWLIHVLWPTPANSGTYIRIRHIKNNKAIKNAILTPVL
jgi:hypothetical protein